MENSNLKHLLRFLSDQEKLTETRLEKLNNILESNNQFPEHVTEVLHSLRHNAEDDLSNILHVKAIYPSNLRTSAGQHDRSELVSLGTSGASGMGQLSNTRGEDDTEPATVADEDLFALDAATAFQHSDDERETDDRDSELDEGIHIPGKFRNISRQTDVAASLPVGIPWTNQMAPAARVRQPGPGDHVEEELPSDIAASIQALAKSVHQSSIFGELPRRRTNTYSKD